MSTPADESWGKIGVPQSTAPPASSPVIVGVTPGTTNRFGPPSNMWRPKPSQKPKPKSITENPLGAPGGPSTEASSAPAAGSYSSGDQSSPTSLTASYSSGRILPNTTGHLPAHLHQNDNITPHPVAAQTPVPPEDEEDTKLRAKEAKLTEEDKLKMAAHALKVREEVLSTEASYLKYLRTLDSVFVQPLKKADLGLTDAQLQALTRNLIPILNLHEGLSKDLESSGATGLEGVFIKYARYFRLYTEYLNGYQTCVDTLTALRQNRKFQQFMQTVKQNLASAGTLDLMSYMIMPVQRVPRYVLLLTELKRHTLPSTQTFTNINTALVQLKEAAVHINEAKRKLENMSTLLSIQDRISGEQKDFSLIQPHRVLMYVYITINTTIAHFHHSY